MRVARRGVRRAGPTTCEQLAHLLAELLAAAPVHAQRLADHPPDRVARVQRRVRVLEDHLHPPAQRPHLALAQVRDVGAVEADRAAGRLVQAQQRPADRRLAAARLADEPERLAALDRQRDAVDRVHVADVPVHDDPAPDREPDPEVVHLDERAAPLELKRHRRASSAATRPPAPG